ncbi:MAG: sulfatase-like hydrolase/transferase, partial [Kiritimatiellae bacterium]|nr:sulfatase-like hydrolase/transferase [Kiritimatiellia bacterium]
MKNYCDVLRIPFKQLSVRLAGIASLLLIAGTAPQPVLAEIDRPLNYLIILGDDISASSLGCYGALNPYTSPNIDKLASEGVRFSNMFVSEAICAPTRAELYTGLQPERNGCYRNHLGTNEGTKSVVHHLEKLGYRVGLAGKRHFWPASVYPFEMIKGFDPKCATRNPDPDDWTGVETFMTHDREQPFCLFICSVHAHAPWTAGDSSLWNLDELKLPAHLVDNEITRHYYREMLAEVRLFDDQVGRARELLERQKLDEHTVLIVLDENGTGMPGGKWTTYDWGVRSACVMKWPASYKAKFTTDAIAQYCDIVPTLIDAAGGAVPANLDGKSLLPLIQAKTQVHREKAYFVFNNRDDRKKDPRFSSRAVTDGRYKLIWTLTPENLYGVAAVSGIDFGKHNKGSDVPKIYGSWLESMKTEAHAAALVKRYRLRPEFQLFDLSADRWEMNNLATNPEYHAKVQELKTAISDWMKQQGDDGHLDGEGITYADTPFAETANKPSLNREKYPPVSEKKPEGISYPYDQLTESALKFMGENKGEPFFMPLPLNLWVKPRLVPVCRFNLRCIKSITPRDVLSLMMV